MGYQTSYKVPGLEGKLIIEGRDHEVDSLPVRVVRAIASLIGLHLLGGQDRGDDIFVEVNGRRIPFSDMPMDVQGTIVEFYERYVEGHPEALE